MTKIVTDFPLFSCLVVFVCGIRARGRHLAHLTTGAAAGGVCGVGLATFSCERLSSVMEERITEGWTNNWSYSA